MFYCWLKLLLIINFITLSVAVHSKSVQDFLKSENISPKKIDIILAEKIAAISLQLKNGALKKDQIISLKKQLNQSKHYLIFENWLNSLEVIANAKSTTDLIENCKKYAEKNNLLPMEKSLERLAGNYCREKTLAAIAKDIDLNHKISDDGLNFIKLHLKFYLTKKNKKNFGVFMQGLSLRPEVMQKISQEVTAYSVQHGIVPSQDVLQDMMINEQITNLIQLKGFNNVQHKNVFYAEFGKLIEQGYRLLETNPSLEQVKETLGYIKNYFELNQDHLPINQCLTRLNDFSKSVFRSKFDELSREIFKYIIKKSNQETREDAIFFLLWTYVVRDDFKEALVLVKKYDLHRNLDRIEDARLKFWTGLVFETNELIKEAITYYENTISSQPLSFYAIMAAKKLQVLKPDSPGVKFYLNYAGSDPNYQFSPEISKFDQEYISSLIRLRSWAKIDSRRFLNLELKRIRRHSLPQMVVAYATPVQSHINSDLHILNASILVENKNYLNAFKYIYEAMDRKEVSFNRQLIQTLYPSPFYSDLKKILKKDNFDPLIVLSLIRQESVFNPLARSPVGARGLMQIMPATAKRIKRSVREKHLNDPKINLEVGTQYFRTLMKRYDQNLVFVLAAYNAGESRVDRWRGTHFDDNASILRNIESIPFLETRNYVKLIFRNIFFYKLMEEIQDKPDSSHINQIFNIKLGFKH